MWNKKSGTLAVGYSELIFLGAITACVFARIKSEFYFAKKHSYKCFGFFFINLDELEIHLGFKKVVLINSLVKLKELNFIDLIETHVKNSYLLKINEDKVSEAIEDFEDEHGFRTWDYGLGTAQNPKKELIRINKDAEVLYEIARDYEVKISAVVLEFCIYYFTSYKNQTGNSFFDNEKNYKEIENYFESYAFEQDDFISFIKELCTN